MALWSDGAIRAAVQSGRLGVEPWHEADLTPNGLDLRVGSVVVPARSPEPITSGKAIVPPMARFLVGTEAVLRLPADAAGSLWLRSSWARRGVLASFGKVDAGFHGNLTVGLLHAGEAPLEVMVGDRFCQIVFEDLAVAAEKAYAERSGNYQHQRGVTMARNP